jgi:hypothetical protein
MNKFYRIVSSCMLIFLLKAGDIRAQNNLAAGDIAFVSYQSDKDLTNMDIAGGYTKITDRFSIVVLKSGGLAAGTVIYFTDNGWNASTANFISGLSEGFIQWTVPAGGIAFGKEVFFISTYNTPAMNWGAYLNEGGTSSAGTVTTVSGTNYMELSTAGDQILAYQTGPTAGPADVYNSTTRRFITAVHANVEPGVTTYAAWDGNTPAGGNQSSIPPGLTNGVNAILLSQTSLPVSTVGSGEYDNAKYGGTGSDCTPATLAVNINNSANLVLNNNAFATGSTSNHATYTLTGVNISSQPNNITACSGLPATFGTTASGGGSVSYQWQSGSDAAFTSPVSLPNSGVYSGAFTSSLNISDNSGLSGTYYRVQITNSCGTVNSTPALLSLNTSTLAPSLSTVTQTVNTNNNLYYSAPCALIAKVVPSGTSPLSGNVTSNVWIENSVPTYGGQPFVARHYQITPAANATTSTGTITLYFTQAEFDAFNAAAISTPKLPVSSSDNVGKSNLRVGKYSGVSNDGTGLPGSYTSGVTVIDPADANIVWNTVESRWEVTFNVSSFSGFIIQTAGNPLPVNLISFSGQLNNNDVSLQWKTSSEINHDYFEVERSTDGQTFTTAGRVPGTNSGSVQNYSWFDAGAGLLTSSKLYYRLKMVSTTGAVEYSNILTFSVNKSASPIVSVKPNPFISNVNISLQMPEAARVAIRLTDITGQLLKSEYINVPKGSTILPITGIGNLVQGIYVLSLQFNGHTYTYKLVK